jgi:hypothetical protein
MKRLSMIMMCLLAMMTASLSAKAQEVMITLYPGWNWISYPKAEVLDVNTALGDFVPVNGDKIKSQFSNSSYLNGQWRGGVTHFMPGWGYMYFSNRTEIVSFVFGEPAPQLIVTTTEPTDITAISAISGGSLSSSDGSYIVVLEKGICWATHPNPTVMNDSHTENGSGINSFTAEMTDLNLNTIYYLRAYAVTESGTTYGEEMNFITRDGVSVVNTASITKILGGSANCGGTVTDDGGLEVLARGVCWSTSSNPTINDNHTIDGDNIGDFTSRITGLTNNTTYYVRAYSSTNQCTSYGGEVCFTTLDIPVGAISGLFSVSATQQVYFSQGNLQFQASTNTWQFAYNQWDCIGEDNGNISPTYDGWIDLFGWGTGTDPTNQESHQSFNEWGENLVSNGGNQGGEWRTLSGCIYVGNYLWEEDEWPYLLNNRTTMSGIRYAKAQVNGMNGIIIVPDNWDSSIYSLNNTNSDVALFVSNIISDNDWEIYFEGSGCVFLPAGGYRYSGSVYSEEGKYWSSSRRTYYMYNLYDTDAFNISFSNSSLNADSYSPRTNGYSVRLVKNYNP